MINVTCRILYIFVEIATALSYHWFFLDRAPLNIIVGLHGNALRLLIFSKLVKMLENQEDEAGANEQHDTNDNEHDYQDMVDLFDFF